MSLDHYGVVRRIAAAYPGVAFSYDGDGTSLGPVYDGDGVLVSRGLEWHDPATVAPTLAELEAMPDPPAAPTSSELLAQAITAGVMAAVPTADAATVTASAAGSLSADAGPTAATTSGSATPV